MTSAPAASRGRRTHPLYLTHFKCHNWHNLTTQEGALDGDIFNIGGVGTGKTTWVEGVQAALTLGESRMSWNSAGSQGLTKQEQQEEGRNLATIILRYANGQYRRASGVGYFAIELSDGDKEHYAIGMGASTASPQSRVHRWGFIIPGSLNKVRFVDERGNLLDRGKFEEHNGATHVYNAGEFLEQLGKLLYENRVGFDRVMALWNLGKSYDDLARRARNYTSLFREILEPPNEEDYRQARQHLEEIRKLSQEIKEREQTRDQLLEVQRSADAIRRHQASLVRYDYFERYDQHLSYTRRRTQLTASIQTGETEAGRILTKSKKLVADREVADARVRDLEATGADALMGRRQTLQDEAERKERRIKTLSSDAKVRRENQDRAEKAVQNEWRRFDTARTEASRGLEQVGARHLDALPQPVGALVTSILDVMRTTTADDHVLPGAYTENLEALRAYLTEMRLSSDREAGRTNRELKGVQEELEAARRDLADLERRAELQPTMDLDEALQGIRDDVRLLYRLLTPRPGTHTETALLESYLPPHVLGALVPKRPADTERIRNHVAHVRHVPQVKVVDAETLTRTPPAAELPADSILQCLDPSASDSVAYAYMRQEYGDVRLLPEANDRDGRARVLWRNGDVYDRTAYHLETVKIHPEFIGPEARQRALEKRRKELGQLVADLDTHAQRLAKEAAKHKARFEELGLIQTEISDTLRNADLSSRLTQVALAKSTSAARATEHQQALTALKDEQRELTEIEGRLTQLLTQIKETGAEDKFRQLDAARNIHKELVGAAEKASIELALLNDRLEREQTELAKVIESQGEAEVKMREMTPLLRRLASEESPPSPTVEDYLRGKGFYDISKDRLDRNRQETSKYIEDAKVNIGILRDRLRPVLPFDYQADRNLVVESGGTRTLADHVDAYNQHLREANKRKTELLQTLNTRIIVDNMARHLGQDWKRMKARVDAINALLADNPIGRRYYQIRVSPDNEKSEIAQMRKYVEESREEAKMDVLADFIRIHLLEMDSMQEKVPIIFDYRFWYQFDVRPVPVKTGVVVEGPRATDSGGEQAIPKYLICFALFHIVYESIHARFRLVILDEAFEKISAGEINQLLATARRLGLTVIATSNKLEPIPVEGGTFTTQMFYVNKNDDTIIERFTRVEVPVGGAS